MREKVVLVTGSARRIGAAIVRGFYEAGYRVVVHYHASAVEATQWVHAFNAIEKNSSIAVHCDLSKPSSSNELIHQVMDWTGRLDVLVNNASLFSRDVNDWDRLFDVNVKSPFMLSQAAFPHLSQVEGCIINITDIHAQIPLKGYAVYCQTKAALWMQTKALAREFAPTVRVNAVAPGAMMWPEGDNSLSVKEQSNIVAETPLKKHGDPCFIAQAVMDLVNQSFTTGQSLSIDGGRSIKN